MAGIGLRNGDLVRLTFARNAPEDEAPDQDRSCRAGGRGHKPRGITRLIPTRHLADESRQQRTHRAESHGQKQLARMMSRKEKLDECADGYSD